MAKTTTNEFLGTGRRKTAIARVRLASGNSQPRHDKQYANLFHMLCDGRVKIAGINRAVKYFGIVPAPSTELGGLRCKYDVEQFTQIARCGRGNIANCF